MKDKLSRSKLYCDDASGLGSGTLSASNAKADMWYSFASPPSLAWLGRRQVDRLHCCSQVARWCLGEHAVRERTGTDRPVLGAGWPQQPGNAVCARLAAEGPEAVRRQRIATNGIGEPFTGGPRWQSGGDSFETSETASSQRSPDAEIGL